MVQIQDLASPRSDTLANPPLELVVAQVRHEPVSAIGDAATVLKVQKRLGAGFDRIEPLAQLIPSVPGLLPGQASGWRLTNDDGWIVSINADSYALECTRYIRWTDFHEQHRKLTEIVAELLQPHLVQRVGLRYVDRFYRESSTKPGEWRGLLEPALLGFGAHSTLADAAVSAQTLSELRVDGLRATIRGSIASDVTPNKFSFLLDTDCYDDRVAPFESTALDEVIIRLHDLGLRLFQSSITSTLYNEIHG